jgi:hypothetical protein
MAGLLWLQFGDESVFFIFKGAGMVSVFSLGSSQELKGTRNRRAGGVKNKKGVSRGVKSGK